MPPIRSDDRAKGLRYKWMGPHDLPLWPWTLPQYVICGVTLLVLWASLAIIRPPVLIGVVLAVVIYPALAGLVASDRVAGRALNNETGLGYVHQTLLAEIASAKGSAPRSTESRIPSDLFITPEDQHR